MAGEGAGEYISVCVCITYIYPTAHTPRMESDGTDGRATTAGTETTAGMIPCPDCGHDGALHYPVEGSDVLVRCQDCDCMGESD